MQLQQRTICVRFKGWTQMDSLINNTGPEPPRYKDTRPTEGRKNRLWSKTRRESSDSLKTKEKKWQTWEELTVNRWEDEVITVEGNTGDRQVEEGGGDKWANGWRTWEKDWRSDTGRTETMCEADWNEYKYRGQRLRGLRIKLQVCYIV